MKTVKLLAALILSPTAAVAQMPNWTVVVTPTLNPLPIGMCGAIHLSLMDPVTRDVPRNPQGYRITMADFDMSVSGGASAAGRQIDASHFEACGCPGGVVGSPATVTATYPAQSLPAAARVPGVSFHKTASFALAAPKGPVNPLPCASLVATNPAAPAAPAAQPASVWSNPVARIEPGPGRSTTPVAPNPGHSPSSGVPAPMAPQPILDAPPARTPGRIAPAPVPASVPAPAIGSNPTSPPAVVPINPSGALAIVAPPDDVLLMWDPVSDAAFYVVFGPGLTPGGQRVENEINNTFGKPSVSVSANNLPPGAHEWLIASYYPGNVSTPAAQFSKASATLSAPEPQVPPAATTPAPASGKYLVTITGVRAYSASMDDLLSRDGTGDEIYAAAYIRRYDRRNSAPPTITTRKSSSHGDTFHFSNQRVQAGTRTPTGGIQDGDMVPGPAFIAMRSVPPQDATFPMQIWEGTLTDGVEAVVISPSLWEQDVGEAFLNQWFQFQSTLNSTILIKQGVQDQISQQAFGSLIFGASANDTNTAGMSHGKLVVDTLLMVFGGVVPFVSITTTTADRPLGLQQNGRDTSVLPNHTVVLTREIIEKALASPALGAIPSPLANAPAGGLMNTIPAIARIGVVAPKPGIIVVHFQDRGMFGTVGLPERPAIYQMYIQVERMP